MYRVDSTLKIINQRDDLLNESSTFFSKEKGYLITNEEILEAIYILTDEKNNYDWIGDVYEKNYSFADIKGLLQNFDFKVLSRTIETDENVIPSDLRINYKVRIKAKGIVWVIHKNDNDPFPSNPHAHMLDSNIKLHLGNGNCYRKRKLIHRIHRKELLSIREKASLVMPQELPNLEV